MVIWLIGLSGAGKSTVAVEVQKLLQARELPCVVLDGDTIREVFGNDVSHDLAGRRRNADRVCALGQLLESQGIHVVAAVLSIFPESRNWNRENLERYFEVYLKVPQDLLESRDGKGLYRDGRAGQRSGVVGIDIPFPEPAHPDLVIEHTFTRTPQDIAEEIVNAATCDSPRSTNR